MAGTWRWRMGRRSMGLEVWLIQVHRNQKSLMELLRLVVTAGVQQAVTEEQSQSHFEAMDSMLVSTANSDGTARLETEAIQALLQEPWH